MRVFLGDSKNSMMALLFICWECILYESACIIGYCTYWVVGEWFVCIVVLQVCVDFGELVSCVHYANVSIFITWFGDNGLVDVGLTTLQRNHIIFQNFVEQFTIHLQSCL